MTDLPVAPDGSPVAIYRALPPPAEADAIAAAIPAASTILDLGAGTGRFARALALRGHRVVAVDHEPAMLAGLEAVPGVEPVVADIIGLDLGRRVDVALLASHLLDDDVLGPAALATARRHLTSAGVVIGESYPADIDWPAVVGRRSALGPVGVTVTAARVEGDRLDAVVRYDLDDATWEQPFGARLLGASGVRDRLAEGGFRFEGWLDEGAGWWIGRVGGGRGGG